ncbi:hypothetical protein VTN96DRAFT_5978 [Rasamsonia emersonii]
MDGLDEYEETCQEDYRDLVELLFSWTRAAPADVKLCVSSREYEVFRNAFSDDKRLRLQDLTRKDIESVVRHRLNGFEISETNGVSADNNKEPLVTEIIDRADGVFLWVALVLKSVREGLQYDNRLSSLIQKVRHMPQDMEPLFHHLLDSISPSDRRAAYRTFAVVLELQKSECLEMSLLRYSFLEDYDTDGNFAMDRDFKDSSSNNDEITSRMERAQRRLNGQCKGLLEVRHDEVEWRKPVCSQSVTFTHRSVFDFVSGNSIQARMAYYCKGYDVVDAICQTFLAELKFSSGQESDPDYGPWLAFEVQQILRLRQLHAKDVDPFLFLECLQT